MIVLNAVCLQAEIRMKVKGVFGICKGFSRFFQKKSNCNF
jgi:hypothetical protein